jgi:hypothetical protein
MFVKAIGVDHFRVCAGIWILVSNLVLFVFSC